MAVPNCRICGNSAGNTILTAREFMFGTGDRFDYVQCAGCGCLQIRDVPQNLADYYPPDYYSFRQPVRPPALRRHLQRRRARYVLEGRDLVGRLLAARYGVPEALEHVRRTGARYDDPILEIGSGSGERLLAMHTYGFTNLTGVDPYVDRSHDPAPGVRIRKREPSAEKGCYALVMLHHTFEHMDAPGAAMADIARLLDRGGTAIVRIPLASSLAFRRYGADWVQLDAPRHLYLHTADSMRLLTGRAGLEITDVVYDSTAFQFWGSEQYRRGIPLRDPKSHAVDPEGSPFSAAEIESYEREAARLNGTGEGDQAGFYLRKNG